MLYRAVPKTNDMLSVLGFGCMRLPEKNGRIDEARAERQIRSAIERGVNYIDTAYPYHMGQSEPFLGRTLGAGLREKVKIATKLPPTSVRTREDMDTIIGRQLENLRTDRIDYYLLHLGDGTSEATHFASQCAGCRQCEKKCPQHLPIAENLRAVAREFESFTMPFFRLLARVFYSRAR